jgi:glucoside 3-dehydrogenase (cytochrome c) hitch-hiker subunit
VERIMNEQHSNTISRRDAIRLVTGLLGGAAIAGSDHLLAYSFDETALSRTMVQGAGAFTAADVALLDEIAETILPETSTPGAKAAKTGAFMALMVTDAYTEERRQVFMEGVRQVNLASTRIHGVDFMTASAAQRLAVVEALDREQKAAMDARLPEPVNRAPAAPDAPDEPAHYFRMMKELALLGFFTSEVGCTKALRYIEAPGRYDPCAPLAPGDRSWAGHA